MQPGLQAGMQAAAARPKFDDQVLPPLRQDLRLIEGGAGGVKAGTEGQWKIHDPMAQRFFEIERDAVDLLAHWGAGTVGAMRAQLAADNGRQVSDESIAALLEFLQRHELVRPVPMQTFARVRRQADGAKRSFGNKLLHSYLFFKVPLARPDAFLRSTQHLVRVFFQPAFWLALAGLGLFSLYLVSRQWDAFLHTFPDMFSVAGIATFGISLALVKTLHELGHGYTAVRMGSRVTTMGVAFVVMTPILYTDTTDAWRLPNRRQRVLIDAAGMAVELIIAVIATYIWIFTPEGALRHAAFALATTSWVMSIAVNCNPLMRFDGYYLFSDMIGEPNLQERSFAMGRWFLREQLFGYGDEQPEPAQGRQRVMLICFAYATWVYRFFLFLGIAFLVYHFFFKALGIFMFAVEMGWFIVLPIWREMKVWLQRRNETGARVRVTSVVTLALLLAFLVPFPYMVRIPAVLTAAEQAPSFAPRPARIEQVLVKAGDPVKAGQVMMKLSAPEIDQQLQAAGDRAALLEERMGRRASDSRDLSDSLVLMRELRLERDRIDGLNREKARLVVQAPMDGTVMEIAAELHPGRWINAQTMLVLVGKPGVLEARGYIDSEDLARIEEGDKGRFVDEHHMAASRDIQVKRIGAAASDSLDNWLLASTFGGPVDARAEGKKARSEHAMFEIAATASSPEGVAPRTELRGEMHVRGAAQSMAVRVFKRVVHVLVREGAA
ncbi:HlyD family efflux transporter periplasmic adaptor subunit [Variovorax sp. dw_308]|uniref:HlyD family efflux transporter periplasmic adaptor subunit n=1 Tax=Variovorax sp. dw_308 TaxID=2721546 RepID=UPI001C4913F6|nr:HlyD family efflux transporter periplasmic adaptor subunit [Variovorax sp. dw_308]